jgi:hypothetical protein
VPLGGTSFIGLRGQNVQDARKWIRLPTHAQPTTRTQIGDLYAVLINGTQELFDLAAQLNRRFALAAPHISSASRERRQALVVAQSPRVFGTFSRKHGDVLTREDVADCRKRKAREELPFEWR